MYFSAHVDVDLDVDEVFDEMSDSEKREMLEMLLDELGPEVNQDRFEPQNPVDAMFQEALDRIAKNALRIDPADVDVILGIASKL